MSDDDDKENINDFLDYYDQDENNSKDNYKSFKEDSFNEDILKVEENHKNVSKPESNANSNRPISSYHRVVQQPNEQEQIDESQNINITELINRLSNHIKVKKITKNDFCENSNLYLDINEFRELFRRIKFDISNVELKALFSQNNQNFNEGYILMNSFFSNYPLEWYIFTVPVKENVEISNFQKLNFDFKNLQDEILQIVKKEEIETENKRIQTSKIRATSNVNRLRQLKTAKPNTNNKIDIGQISKDKSSSTNNNLPNLAPKKFVPKNFLGETLKKKQAEEEMLRVALEKRNKENEKEFLKKITEANLLCKELNINKAFSAFINESFGTLMCRVHLRGTQEEPQEVDFKKFIVELRKLRKLKDQREAAKMWQDNQTKNPDIKTKNKIKLDNRRKMQDDIKKTLIDSIISKQKLKRQLKALRDKKIMDEKVIQDNLKLTNLEDSY